MYISCVVSSVIVTADRVIPLPPSLPALPPGVIFVTQSTGVTFSTASQCAGVTLVTVESTGSYRYHRVYRCHRYFHSTRVILEYTSVRCHEVDRCYYHSYYRLYRCCHSHYRCCRGVDARRHCLQVAPSALLRQVSLENTGVSSFIALPPLPPRVSGCCGHGWWWWWW